jgi:hypothetical protein
MTTPLAERYGRSGTRLPGRWIAIGLGVLVVAAGLGIAYTGYRKLGTQDVKGEQVSFAITSPSAMSITFLVTREDPSRPAVCIIRARSRDGAETGRREILVEPSGSGTVQLTATVRGARPPVTGDVYGCGLDVPAYLQRAETS